MGVMVQGHYHSEDPGPETSAGGAYQRETTTIRNWIANNGAFPPASGRYHLYAAWSCPWAHRALLARVILGLQDDIGVSFAAPRRTDQGWVFAPEGRFADPLNGIAAIHELYARQKPAFTGRLTVPVLWDKDSQQIVSNESADIIRMLGVFPGVPDLYPAQHQAEIDQWNTLIYKNLNNGVYRAGFARSQEAYETGVTQVFETLDHLEAHLAHRDWIVSDQMTEVDLRLFPTLARFDVAYVGAFKCNIHRLVDYPNLWAYARRIYAMPGVASTVDFDIIKGGYYSPSALRNPLGIVPVGPKVNWQL
ncbi:glutathione S-transferase family protein [Cognatishimia sp. WU-CL00825]|uniref:glutathione S-transferase family protein n=1 Tax=Cognatishimia sp. WU-CL00825 TaxID=3127658 RepID=UPI003108AFC4